MPIDEHAEPFEPPDLTDKEVMWVQASIDDFRWQRSQLRAVLSPLVVQAEPFERERDSEIFARFWAVDMIDELAWRVRGELAVDEAGVPAIRRMIVEPWTPQHRREVTGVVLRRLRVGLIRDRAVAALRDADWMVDFEKRLGWRPSPEEETRIRDASRKAKTVPKRGRAGYPPGHYRRIAFEYLELLEQGWTKGILRELARREERPRDTIRDWIRRARELGFLTPGKPGRAGAAPGPNLYELEEKKETR